MTEGKAQTLEDAIRVSYQTAVGLWGIQPSEFWAMTPQEWWWINDVKVAVNRPPGAVRRLSDLEAWAKAEGEKYRGRPKNG